MTEAATQTPTSLAVCLWPGCGTRLVLALALCMGATLPQAFAVTCTTQASLKPAERAALLADSGRMADAIASQNLDALQALLLPSVTADWPDIRNVAQSAVPLIKGGSLSWGDAYLLDATDLKAAADTQFFCISGENNVTITINLRNLPAGRYALMIGDYAGAPLGGQLAVILGQDTTATSATASAASAAGPPATAWKLGGLFAREGALEGHDGVWYWSRAREQAAHSNPWAAWFSYDTARWLLIPIDFLSSPHLEKLNREQADLKASPQDALPMTVVSPTDPAKTWKVTSLHLDTTLHFADLALTYDSTGLTDPLAARAEAEAVMSGLLKLHPELRESFHGLWAYAEKDGKRNYAIELAMHDIP